MGSCNGSLQVQSQNSLQQSASKKEMGTNSRRTRIDVTTKPGSIAYGSISSVLVLVCSWMLGTAAWGVPSQNPGLHTRAV
jgi:hypothetical protein